MSLTDGRSPCGASVPEVAIATRAPAVTPVGMMRTQSKIHPPRRQNRSWGHHQQSHTRRLHCGRRWTHWRTQPAKRSGEGRLRPQRRRSAAWTLAASDTLR
jgi:hypothetical protein